MKCRKTPFRINLTRDPLPSSLLAPSATSKASMSFQGIFALTGISKMDFKVFECLLFIII
ncbi:MAG: hypothetical protein ACD_39C01331G0003 [uncultured bacterium]|nr:MAG: hypothetical protein ACD_39C01331G0003 [uncultured bacterium]